MNDDELEEIREDFEEAAEHEVEQEISQKDTKSESENDNESKSVSEKDTGSESESEKISKELAAVKDQLLRTMAEYDNFRKRSAKEKDALRADIIANVTAKFLPVMDNLERALSVDCTDEKYKSGVEMINNSFINTLKDLGVEEISSTGAEFDPNYHQAVQRVDDSDAESGTVVQTFAKGYKIGDKVIRFAMVAVAN